MAGLEEVQVQYINVWFVFFLLIALEIIFIEISCEHGFRFAGFVFPE